jgi:streptogramin lyase
LKQKRHEDGTWVLGKVNPDVGARAQWSLREKASPFALEEAGESSKWITLTALRVLKRIEESS